MSEQPENQQVQDQSSRPEKSGCMTWLGVLLLLAAVLATLFIFIVKPALEEKGIDVEEKIETVKAQSQEFVNSAKSKISDVGAEAAEKYNELKKKSEEISNSETVEKIKDTVEKVKDSEVVSKTAEKVKAVGSEVAEKAENGGSWY